MNINELVNSSVAVQVKFWDSENWCAGIVIGHKLICACCGGVFEVDEVLEYGHEDGVENPIVPYDKWVNLSEEILGDDI